MDINPFVFLIEIVELSQAQNNQLEVMELLR